MDTFNNSGLQVIRQNPEWTTPGNPGYPPATFDEVKAYKDYPTLLGWFMEEEPTGKYWGKNMSGHYEDYLTQYASLKSLDPVHPIFNLDCPWISPPATEWRVLRNFG